MSNRILNVITCLLLWFATGCHQSFERKLINGDFQFWDHYDPSKGYVLGSYGFSKDGSCFYYTLNKGVRNKMYNGDVVYPHKWMLKDDSTINILGFDRRIIRFVNDTLLLQNIVTNDTIYLIRVKDK